MVFHQTLNKTLQVAVFLTATCFFFCSPAQSTLLDYSLGDHREETPRPPAFLTWNTELLYEDPALQVVNSHTTWYLNRTEGPLRPYLHLNHYRLHIRSEADTTPLDLKLSHTDCETGLNWTWHHLDLTLGTTLYTHQNQRWLYPVVGLAIPLDKLTLSFRNHNTLQQIDLNGTASLTQAARIHTSELALTHDSAHAHPALRWFWITGSDHLVQSAYPVLEGHVIRFSDSRPIAADTTLSGFLSHHGLSVQALVTDPSLAARLDTQHLAIRAGLRVDTPDTALGLTANYHELDLVVRPNGDFSNLVAERYDLNAMMTSGSLFYTIQHLWGGAVTVEFLGVWLYSNYERSQFVVLKDTLERRPINRIILGTGIAVSKTFQLFNLSIEAALSQTIPCLTINRLAEESAPSDPAGSESVGFGGLNASLTIGSPL